MRFMVSIGALFLASTSVCAAGPEISVKDLEASSKWWLDYAGNVCVVHRGFGSGDSNIVLRLARSSPGNGMSLTMVGKALKSGTPVLDIPLMFEDGTPVPPTQLLIANTGKAGDNPALIFSNARLDNFHGSAYPKDSDPPDVTPAREAAVTSMIFRAPNRKWIRLKTGSMKGIMAAMRTCTDKVIESWGYSPAVQHTLTRPATPKEDPSKWLGVFDYPQSMLQSGQMAIVDFRLDITETGDVGDCTVISATLPKEASKATCKLISRRAKFLPALDASGAAVKTYYMSTVRWVIR